MQLSCTALHSSLSHPPITCIRRSLLSLIGFSRHLVLRLTLDVFLFKDTTLACALNVFTDPPYRHYVAQNALDALRFRLGPANIIVYRGGPPVAQLAFTDRRWSIRRHRESFGNVLGHHNRYKYERRNQRAANKLSSTLPIHSIHPSLSTRPLCSTIT